MLTSTRISQACLTVLSLMLWTACNNPERVAGGGAEDVNSLTGQVLDKDGKVVAAASVILRRSDYLATRAEVVTKDSKESRDAITDAKGRYHLDSLADGQYRLEIRGPNEQGSIVEVEIGGDSQSWKFQTIALESTAKVIGKIFWGRPISGRYVAQVYGLERLAEIDSSNGAYSFTDLPAGSHGLRVYSPTYPQLTPHVFKPIALEPGQALAMPTVSFDPITGEKYSAWAHSVKVTIDLAAAGTSLTTDLHDFPILIRLSEAVCPSGFFQQTRSDGRDLRFAKADGTPLRYEVERFDSAARHGEVWVKLDTLHGKQTSQSISMYWGLSEAPNLSDGTIVFDTAQGFTGVWHLGQEATGKGQAGVYRDATANGLHGQDNVGIAAVEGITGKAAEFDGLSDYIRIAASAHLNMQKQDVTVSIWLWTQSKRDTEEVLFEHGVWDKPGTYQLTSMADTNLRWNFATPLEVEKENPLDIQETFNDGQWHQLTAAYTDKDSSARIYFDGREIGTKNHVASIGLGGAESFIGGRVEGPLTYYFHGRLDELRVSRLARQPEWIKLAYENQKPNSKLIQITASSGK